MAIELPPRSSTPPSTFRSCTRWSSASWRSPPGHPPPDPRRRPWRWPGPQSRQKGRTGRARQGSTPVRRRWHRPRPAAARYTPADPKDEAAAHCIPCRRARNGRVHVITEFVTTTRCPPQNALNALHSSTDRKALVIVDRQDSLSGSAAQRPRGASQWADKLSTYDASTKSDDDVDISSTLAWTFLGRVRRSQVSLEVQEPHGNVIIAPVWSPNTTPAWTVASTLTDRGAGFNLRAGQAGARPSSIKVSSVNHQPQRARRTALAPGSAGSRVSRRAITPARGDHRHLLLMAGWLPGR